MYKIIISPENLNNIIDDENLIIFDCRFNLLKKKLGYINYLESHIKNAYYINLESDLSSEATGHSGRHPLPEISKFNNLLNFYGINKNSQIVLYDDENSSICSRFWWMLKLVGFENCAVLDGGYKFWYSKKFPTDNLIPKNLKKENIEYFYNNDYLIDTKNLINRLQKKDLYLIDARDKVRFLGKKEPIDKKAGHIPGAINMPFKNNLDKEGKFKSKLELKKLFEKINIDDSKEIINMCGSGVTACHNFLAMEYCGLRKSKIYVGSWSAWSSYSDNEIAKE